MVQLKTIKLHLRRVGSPIRTIYQSLRGKRSVNSFQLPDGKLLGKWLYERSEIWRISLEDEVGIDEFCRNRGLVSLFIGDHVKLLWHLGVLKADLVESENPLDVEGLVLIDEDESLHIYADERGMVLTNDGLMGAAKDLPEIETGVKLFFHPFRYYILYQLLQVIDTRITPIQLIFPEDYYLSLLQKELNYLKSFTSDQKFEERFQLWNRTTAIAIASEPYFFQQLFNTVRRPIIISQDEFDQRTKSHWEDVKQSYKSLGLEQLEIMRRDLCIAAEMLDPNKNVHTLLRLTQGASRFENIKGRLGGSIILLSMAEIIRRGCEDTFNTQLKEEDELGFGVIPDGIKKELYGADRIIDSSKEVQNEFIRSLGLDYSVRLRWYIEGDTEYYAIDTALGRYGAIELINLRGQVAQKGGKGLAFRDSLRNDLKSKTFSFISIDGDREDNIRVLKKAAEDDEICGMFFISRPDFEFQNFTLEELEEIIWEFCIEAGVTVGRRQIIKDAISGIDNSTDLINAVRNAIPELSQFGKGEDWGNRLITYAWENPEISNQKSGEVKRRDILVSIDIAVSSVGSNYSLSRKKYKVDPNTGKPIQR